MDYINNAEIIDTIKKIRKSPKSKKLENKLCEIFQLITQKNLYRREFVGYKNLHTDMVGEAYYYLFLHFQRGNIKIKNTEPQQVTRTIAKASKIPKSQILILKKLPSDRYKVRRIKLLSTPGKKVKEIKYLDNKKFIITYDDIKYNDVFAYITSIITTSFWKIVTPEVSERRKHQMIFNLEIRNNEYISTNESSKYDFTSDADKVIIEEMQQEAIEFEKNRHQKKERVRKVVVPKNNLFN